MPEFGPSAKIFVAGHRGLVGSAISTALRDGGHENLVERTRAELDLTDQAAVDAFFDAEDIEFVFLAAAKVGGIHANNTERAEFIYDNLVIETNVIDAAYRHGVEKLLFLGSSCIYPKLADQPIREEALLTGPLEETNEPYAIAKIAGVKLCEAYRRQYGFDAISLMPTNLYGPGDNFDLESSHVIPALVRKAHEAKVTGAPTMTVWGSGEPRREFLHVRDLADATVFLMANYDEEIPINVGVGEDVTVRELAELVADAVGFTGELAFDGSKPDGTPRKVLDVSRLNALGWRAKISLPDGLAETYRWYLEDGDALAAE
ncbi:MAG: GDP-L-fucose synthase [Alphaproteobacteria bacterium]|nr:GDP-L-fucose synthase [Alphaproteobacteria bacterium]